VTALPGGERGGPPSWRGRLRRIIFEAETPAGRAFDVALLVTILVSVLAVVLESVAAVREAHGTALRALEWTVTLLFTVEYVLRLMTVGQPWRYATSFFGVVDLLAILPSYLALVVPETQALMVIRALRLLRVFRVLKLTRFVREAHVMALALQASRQKITVFFGGLLTTVLIVGALMHLIELGSPGFESIPSSMYWAIVTITTVGYGDVSPQTPLGKAMASLVMVLGYSIIAVPTGIVSVEIARASRQVSTRACPECSREGHDPDAVHCKFCGARLRGELGA
jgi:voltage-gated potassium channel